MTTTFMVENETLQDAQGLTGVYNGPVLQPEPDASTTLSQKFAAAIDMSGPPPSDDPDAPPPPLTDVNMDDDEDDRPPPLPHGPYGQMVYMNHDEFLKFTGDWDHGVWVKGTLLYTNGNVYSGPWNQRGQPHGPNGKLEWVVPAPSNSTTSGGGEDTRTYVGDWHHGTRHGQGTYTWSRTGAIYQGAFVSNQRQGYGTYRDPMSSIEYVGEWNEGVYHGYGQYTWRLHGEKCVYRGNFENGKPHGHGVQVNEQGDVMHEGKWEHGKPVSESAAAKQTTPSRPTPQKTAAAVPNTSPKPKPTNATLYRESSPVTPRQQQSRALPGMVGPPNTTPAGRTPVRRTVTHIPATATPPPAAKAMSGGGSVTVVHDREWMDTVNHIIPTLGIYRGLWLHQNPYQNGLVVYQEGSVSSYEGWFNPQGYFHGQECRLSFRNGDVYVGDFQFGQRHGKGLYTWKDGRQYKGQFVKNARQGAGTLIYPNSDFYEGQFVQGKRQGRGRFIFSSGSMYEGQWRAGQYHGNGTLVQADGCTYVGGFQQGVKHGPGKDLNPSGVVVFEGAYNRGQPLAEGEVSPEEAASPPATPSSTGRTAASVVAAYQNQSNEKAKSPQQSQQAGSSSGPQQQQVESYWVEDEGDEKDEHLNRPRNLSPPSNAPPMAQMVEDEPPCHAVVDQEITDCQGNLGRFTGIVLSKTHRPHGVGRLVYADGKRIHEGFWKNGSKEGHGRCLFFPQGDFHEGEYQNNLRNGPGRYQWKDGRLFVGSYKDDMRHGKGMFTYPTGDKYDGMFAKGQRSGYGKFVFTGGMYEGEWSAGKYHGRGRLVWGRGTEYEGDFAQGTFHGMGTLRDRSGNILEKGRWFQGKRVASAAPRAPPPASAPPPPPQPPQAETPAKRKPTPAMQESNPAVVSSDIAEGSESTPESPKEHVQIPNNSPPASPPHDDVDDNGHSTLPSEQGGGEDPVETKQHNDDDQDKKSDDGPIVAATCAATEKGTIESYVVEADDDEPALPEEAQSEKETGGTFPSSAVEL